MYKNIFTIMLLAKNGDIYIHVLFYCYTDYKYYNKTISLTGNVLHFYNLYNMMT